MGKAIDMTGQKYGRLTVISQANNLYGKRAWNCHCDCGKSKIVTTTHLKTLHTTSCGCLWYETRVKNGNKSNGEKNITHGMSRHPLDGVLKAMKQRCHNPDNPRYGDYGGRGIKVCEEWLTDRSTFFKWALESGYQSGLSIDRKNNDKGYSPDNCEWVTTLVQNRNTRKNIFITISGRRQTLPEWAIERKIRTATVYNRIYTYGWSIEEALGFVDPPRLPGFTRKQRSQ